jgi:prepilin-type processing-associated H-X9-DG protein
MAPEFKTAEIKAGVIFPYVKDIRVYKCPIDISVKSEITYMMSDPFDMRKMSTVAWPSSSILLVEEYEKGVWYRNDGTIWPLKDVHNWRAGGNNLDLMAPWHAGRGIVGFSDGHVKAVLQQELTPTWGAYAGGPYPRLFQMFQPDRVEEGQ